MDLEFAVQCVLVSSAKIFGIGSDVQDAEITTLVRSSFSEGIRINLPSILRWCALSEEVRLFFSMFRLEGPEMISAKTLQENEFVVYEKHLAEKAEDRAFPTEVVSYVSQLVLV